MRCSMNQSTRFISGKPANAANKKTMRTIKSCMMRPPLISMAEGVFSNFLKALWGLYIISACLTLRKHTA